MTRADRWKLADRLLADIREVEGDLSQRLYDVKPYVPEHIMADVERGTLQLFELFYLRRPLTVAEARQIVTSLKADTTPDHASAHATDEHKLPSLGES